MQSRRCATEVEIFSQRDDKPFWLPANSPPSWLACFLNTGSASYWAVFIVSRGTQLLSRFSRFTRNVPCDGPLSGCVEYEPHDDNPKEDAHQAITAHYQR